MTDPTNPYQLSGQSPAIPRPALTARQRSGARLAGIIGFLTLSLGFTMLSVPLAILAVMALFSLVFGAIGRRNGNPEWYQEVMLFVERLHPEVLIVPLVIVAVLGAVLMVVALFVSARILRSHGIVKAWPITWAAAGVAIVANWIAAGLISAPLQLMGSGSGSGSGDDGAELLPLRIGIAVLGVIVNIVATAVIGWLSWWWMAHLMRPATETSDDITSDDTQTDDTQTDDIQDLRPAT